MAYFIHNMDQAEGTTWHVPDVQVHNEHGGVHHNFYAWMENDHAILNDDKFESIAAQHGYDPKAFRNKLLNTYDEENWPTSKAENHDPRFSEEKWRDPENFWNSLWDAADGPKKQAGLRGWKRVYHRY